MEFIDDDEIMKLFIKLSYMHFDLFMLRFTVIDSFDIWKSMGLVPLYLAF